MERGRFITFEGGEGAGKSTQVSLVAERLRCSGREVLATREPGGAPGAEDIRDLLVNGATERWTPMAEALLNYAARAEHITRTIAPALENGIWVVCDRFFDSTTAYQGYGHGLDIDKLDRIRRAVLDDFKPDMTIILDLPLKVGLKRAKERKDSEDRYERMGIDFHQRLRQGFVDIAAEEPGRCFVIDATAGIDAVAEAVWLAVDRQLGLAK